MIRDFDNWNTSLSEVAALDEFANCTIAIEAADYITNHLLIHSWKEPLLPALGGLPFGMKHRVESDLEKFKAFHIQPIFVFSGLAFGEKEDVFRVSEIAAEVNEQAWDLYDKHQAELAVARFGESTSVKAEDLFRAFQSILHEHKIPFQVAPYSAWAQLAYLEKHCRNRIHAIAGSSELLLFDCDKFITSFDFPNGQARWIKRDKCIADLKRFTGNGDISGEMFVDACMLSGTNFLPTLPQLNHGNARVKQPKPHSAIEMMMMGPGRSGIAVCLQYQDEPSFQQINYLDKYRKTRMAVKHHPILTDQGKIEPLDAVNVPNDVHEFIGQRLPDEIYYYLSKGLIGPRVLNWRTSGEIVELKPLDGGDSDEYRKLVSVKLTPMRTTAISLLSYSLHRFYQHKDLALKCYFDDGQGGKHTDSISMRDLTDPRPLVEKWNVKAEGSKDETAKYQGGLLGKAILSLKDAQFGSKTITAKNPKVLLSTNEEILSNAVWRFLHLRGYIDSNHKLTPWGEVLATTIAALEGNAELEEAATIAVELARLDLLNAREMFRYGGAPMRGELVDKRNNLLVSRVACLGNLRHKPIGFTGPLSRHMLAYHSMTTAVRSTLRDLAEVSLTTILLSGDAKRPLSDPYRLGMDLPFLLPNTCALGIAVKSYLDELLAKPGLPATADETKAMIKEDLVARYFPQCLDIIEDLKTAFKLWDAVYAGIKSAGDLVKDKQVWNETNEWLADRR